ncbi:hypothetical protein L7F22_045877 [Adiantum nelumboides]|nr:hypothetical protein [Adiantum nelumboides]
MKQLLLLMMTMAAAVVGIAQATTFTLSNGCPHDVWPGVLAAGGQPMMTGSASPSGFLLTAGQKMTLSAAAGWSGRLWGRTGCSFDSSGKGTCMTGDCGGQLACNGAGGSPPVTLAEFTLGAAGKPDFYDVSLVDGYNVGMAVAPVGGSGANCSVAGCTSDLLRNGGCPAQLQVTAVNPSGASAQVVACRSACAAFGSPQFCCTGAFANPQACAPSSYSQLFKRACPTAYSYAFDDPTSTFTCLAAASYTITFCPSA